MGQAKQRKAEIDELKAATSKTEIENLKAAIIEHGCVDITLIANGQEAMKVLVPAAFFRPTSTDFERKAAELLAGTAYFFDGTKDTAYTYSIACAVFLHSQKQKPKGSYVIDVLSAGPGQPCAIAYHAA